jgi:hypothetical protein
VLINEGGIERRCAPCSVRVDHRRDASRSVVGVAANRFGVADGDQLAVVTVCAVLRCGDGVRRAHGVLIT